MLYYNKICIMKHYYGNVFAVSFKFRNNNSVTILSQYYTAGPKVCFSEARRFIPSYLTFP